MLFVVLSFLSVTKRRMNVDRDRICEGGFTIDRTNFKSHGRRTVTLRIVLNEDGIMTPNELCPADPHYPACERL